MTGLMHGGGAGYGILQPISLGAKGFAAAGIPRRVKMPPLLSLRFAGGGVWPGKPTPARAGASGKYTDEHML